MVKKSNTIGKKFSRKHKIVKVVYNSGLTEDKTMPLSFLKRLIKDGYESLNKIKEVVDLNTNTDIKNKLTHEPKKRHEHEYKLVWSNELSQVYECSICKKVGFKKVKKE